MQNAATSRPRVARYVGALAVCAATIVARAAFGPALGDADFAIFLIGMLLAAWVGGVIPAFLVQTVLLVVEANWFEPERPSHSPMTLEGIVSLVAFYSVGLIVAGLSQAWRNSRARLLAKSEEAVSQRERLRTILTCMADGVMVTDVDGRVTLMNPTAEQMTGWTSDQAIGKSVLDVFVIEAEQATEAVRNPVARVLRGKQVLHESAPLLLVGRHERLLPVSYSAAPIYDADGQVKGIVLIIRDESARRQAERELLEADQRKDQFLATLAHELRNPLAPIVMGLQLLREEQQAEAGGEGEDEIIDLMDRQAQHMVRLIDDLLDVSRITRGKLALRLEETELAAIVRDTLEAVRPSLDEAGHLLEIDLPTQPVHFHADPNRVTQVLSNLLDNAIKYTPPEGKLYLGARADDTQLTITIADNGFGIPREKLESIFEMFMQVRDKMENGHKGLGIGLTLVKQLVEMHRGRIEVTSDGPDCGSTFTVTLPLARTHQNKAQAPPTLEVVADAGPARQLATKVPTNGAASAPREPRPKGHRVLVVDDNADALRSLSLIVSRLGHETHQAHDGQEAIEAAERLAPDVVLMDIGMPRLNGFDAARRIREQPWGQSLLLVATTGWGQEEDRRRTKEAGFDHHLVKPVDPVRIKQLLAAHPRRDPSPVGVNGNGRDPHRMTARSGPRD